MKKFLLLSATALVAMAPSAFAADIVPPAAPTWTAIHIGVGGGGAWNTYDANSEFNIDPWNEFVPEFIGIDSDNGKFYGFGTVEIGADYQFEDTGFVVGILGSYDFNGSNSASSDTLAFGEDGVISGDIESEIKDTWFLGGRAGFAFNDTSLLYALGGYTWAKGKVKSELGFDFGQAGDDFGEIDEDDNIDGWTAGAGIEQLLTENISLKIEYRHDFLDSVSWNKAPFDPEWGGVDEDNNANGKVKFERDTIRAVLSWRFGL